MKRLIITITICFVVLISNSQEYFQQKVDTYIDVELDDENHILRGFEKMVYYNNSPSVLNKIIIHLWPNAYKNSNTNLAKQKYSDGSISFNNFGAEARLLTKYTFVNRNATFLVGSKFYKSNNSGEQGPGSDDSGADFSYAYDQYPNYSNQSNYAYPNLNYSTGSKYRLVFGKSQLPATQFSPIPRRTISPLGIKRQFGLVFRIHNL